MFPLIGFGGYGPSLRTFPSFFPSPFGSQGWGINLFEETSLLPFSFLEASLGCNWPILFKPSSLILGLVTFYLIRVFGTLYPYGYTGGFQTFELSHLGGLKHFFSLLINFSSFGLEEFFRNQLSSKPKFWDIHSPLVRVVQNTPFSPWKRAPLLYFTLTMCVLHHIILAYLGIPQGL